MKPLFFLSLIIATVPAWAQINVTVKWAQRVTAPGSDTIYYNADKKLQWADFKGRPGEPADALAITSSGLGYQAAMLINNNKTTINVDVYCYFSKQNSWVRKGRESAYALTHEQHHFDVTYIVTNLFVQKLKTAKFTRSNYDTLIEKIYNDCCRELEKMQNDYDGQTKNGQLKNIQSEWNEKIEQHLKDLGK